LQGLVGRRSGVGNRPHVINVVGALIPGGFAAVTALGTRLRSSSTLDFSLIHNCKHLWKMKIALA
jgi:hypothetical protein